MLPFSAPAVYQASKCFVTYGVMGHLDPKQPPSKSKPWTTLASQDFIHRADLIIPQQAYEAVQDVLIKDKPAPQFKRVFMSLADILADNFLEEYIKKRNIMMLSEGRRGIDNVFALRQGTLTMFLDKEAYERAGLVGKPHGVKGKRGLKPRWVVEFDLTASSMFPGKKGFDRLVYASKNALSTPLTWLFCSISDDTPMPDPLDRHHPTTLSTTPNVSQGINALTPTLTPSVDSIGSGGEAREEFESFCTELYEWLSLVRLGSPRIQPGDQIDPYLCRYHVPGEENQQSQQLLCKINWQGFLAPSWARQTLIDIITALPSKTWFSFSTTTFSKGMAGDNAECTFLRPQDSSPVEYILWEVKGHE
ncbi:ribonuclease P 40kDa subunit-domain-containing protein [Apodospora peruviana]|uniref:Ribonuclease P 40kDa subunit-domain-containing protein n=1 Tax=Apodospora peruviana TaxID=516989 RepID=A0AAE0I692_9PEZI|nr:ribonuclease P 40kDa subunit-domain-containing protein [Apodospora peruviana]